MGRPQLKRWTLTLTLDGSPIGEINHLTDQNMQTLRRDLRTVFGPKLRTRTTETWLRDIERQPASPPLPHKPARARLRQPTSSGKKLG